MEVPISVIVSVPLTVLSLIGGLIVRDRQIFKAITEGDSKISGECEERAAKLHARINKETVNRGEMTTLTDSINLMREEQRETNKRIDQVLLIATNCRTRPD